jgi:hypothetical protein
MRIFPFKEENELLQLARELYLDLGRKVGREVSTDDIRRIKFKKEREGIMGWIKKENGSYTIFLNSSLVAEKDLKSTLYHELGEVIVDKFWVGREEQEKIAKFLEENKDSAVKTGEEVLIYYISNRLNICEEFVEECFNHIRKKGDKIKVKNFLKIIKPFYTIFDTDLRRKIAEEIGDAILYRTKIDLHSFLRDQVEISSLDRICPPFELSFKTRKINDFISYLEEEIKKVEKYLQDERYKSIKNEYEKLKERLSIYHQTLNNYKQNLERFYSLDTYRQGLCEYIALALSLHTSQKPEALHLNEKMALGPPFFLKDRILFFEEYGAGLKLFLKSTENTISVPEIYQFISKALDSSDFDQFKQLLSQK